MHIAQADNRDRHDVAEQIFGTRGVGSTRAPRQRLSRSQNETAASQISLEEVGDGSLLKSISRGTLFGKFQIKLVLIFKNVSYATQ